VQVDHSNIVKIHDFVQQPDPRTGLPVGYIVMEYLGGRSLQDIFLGHHDEDGRRAPLPLRLVLAYGLEILDALAYLKAAEEGRALTETRFPTLNERAAQMVQGVIDLATKLEEGQAA